MTRNRQLGYTLDPLYIGGGVTRAPVLVDLIYVSAPTGNPANVVLDPCAPDGCRFVIKDVRGNAGTQSITVSTSPDHLILSPQVTGNPTATVVINVNFGEMTFTYSMALQRWLATALDET